jgi:hypothetical protein
VHLEDEVGGEGAEALGRDARLPIRPAVARFRRVEAVGKGGALVADLEPVVGVLQHHPHDRHAEAARVTRGGGDFGRDAGIKDTQIILELIA